MKNENKLKDIIKEYEKEYRKALILVKQKKVRKYIFKPSDIERWVVNGKTRQYIVLPNIFCQCEDFYRSVVIWRRKKMCYHLLAQIIAEALDEYKEIILYDEDYNDFISKLDEHTLLRF